MRIRQQFISNSSSTSYVCVGLHLDTYKSLDDLYAQYENIKNIDIIYIDNHQYFVGKILHDFDGADVYLSAKQIVETFNEVAQKLDVKAEDLELFCGTVES